jgi:hypothetical protein
MSDLRDISAWLDALDITYKRIGNEMRWEVDAKHSDATYTLHITVGASWVSFAAELFECDPSTTLDRRDKLKQYVLELNVDLMGAHIGYRGDIIVLVFDEQIINVNQNSFTDDLIFFDNLHQVLYPQLLKQAKKLGVKLKRPI